MMECPQCHRTYAEDFSFCLDDGTRLVDPRALEKTAILQTPQQAALTEINPASNTADIHVPDITRSRPPSPASHRSLGKTILVLSGVILIVLLWGMIKVGLWWLDHNQSSTNENRQFSTFHCNGCPKSKSNAVLQSTISPVLRRHLPSTPQPVKRSRRR